jgi:hypothetical protein
MHCWSTFRDIEHYHVRPRPVCFVAGWMDEVAALTPSPASSCAAKPLQLGSDAAAARDGMKAVEHIKTSARPYSGLCCSSSERLSLIRFLP